MGLLVLPVVFALLWLQVWIRRSRLGAGSITRRGAFILAFLIFETLLLAITELSSIGHHFTRGVVVTSWLIIAIFLLGLSWRTLKNAGRELLTRDGPRRLIAPTTEFLRTETAAWLLIPLFFFGIFVYLAVAYLPSNADSLDYHLARVMHWIQDRSVAPFPAHFTAQVDYSPLAEYNLAHFHLLFGGDLLDGFVQLFAALVCLVAVSEIARLLGGGPLVQVGAVVICTTIPSLVLSATSTENNLFLASLCVCLLYVLLALSPLRHRWTFAVFAGLAAALALMTKGSAVALIGPVAVALVIWRVVTESGYSPSVRMRRGAQIAGVTLLTGLVVAGPFLYQDQTLFGTPEGPDAQALLSPDLTWRAAGADVVRSISANFLVGNGQNGPVTDSSRFLLERLHDVYDAFGVPQDSTDYAAGPIVNLFAERNFVLWDRTPDGGADPLDVILICVAGTATLILLLRGDRKMRAAVVMSLGLTVGFLLFAGVSRWQIFGVRLFIPLFVAWSPVIALALARCSPWLLRLSMVVLAVAALPQLLDNAERPVVRNSYGPNPLAPYFLDSTDQSYVVRTTVDLQTMSRVLSESSCRRLGIGSFVAIEYPVWIGLYEDGWHGEIQDVGVDNVTRRYEDRHFHPSAILTEPTSPYWGTVSSEVEIGFGPQLALSISPQDMRSVNVPIPHFSSRVPGVRIFPGSGWRFGPSPTLTGVGTLLITSATAQTVDLQINGPGTRAGIGVTVTPPGARGRTFTTTNGSGLAQVTLTEGVTSVQLDDVPPPDHSTGVDGVSLEGATRAGPT